MARKTVRSHHKGLLTTMVKYPKGSARPKKASIVRRVAFWVGTVALGAALVIVLAALVVTSFSPDAGKREGEGDFPVDRVVEGPPGYRPTEGVVAEAIVAIERTWTAIPLTAESREGVEKGSILHIRYQYVPRMGLVKILDWRPRARGAVLPVGKSQPETPPR